MKTLLTSTFIFLFYISNAQQLDFSWLEGTWKGPGFGGTFEETWSAPDDNGAVMGMFRFADEKGDIQFLEFWVVDASGMKLKHFNTDFTGWEEKDGFVNFEMIKVETNKLMMKGLVYERTGDTMKIDLKLDHEGKVTTEHFELKKIKL